MECFVNIIGAGIAGLSAAIALSEKGIHTRLISRQRSERAQSVLAEGGINASLDTMGEGDTAEEHFRDTMAGGDFLADPNAVWNLCSRAPKAVMWLRDIGVPFNMDGNRIMQRNFGGQKKKRTAYAKSSTGKAIVTALIDEARRFEDSGLIERFASHDFVELILSGDGNECSGVRIKDTYTGKIYEASGPVIFASGGMNGMFPGYTTGTVQNSGEVTARAFSQGVMLANLEMIQYHPTTVGIPGKRCLVSESARGEGGRLYINRKDGRRWYFMEEKYPELKNLMPRDVVSREMYFVLQDEGTGDAIYLDMTGIDAGIWETRLSDLRDEIKDYMKIDPAAEPVPVNPGIHYFMGGIYTDKDHKTNIRFLFAAGECTSQYHGANRLGGNSTLGALIGGRIAAESCAEALKTFDGNGCALAESAAPDIWGVSSDNLTERLGSVLYKALGIVRCSETLDEAAKELESMRSAAGNRSEAARILLAQAMVGSALMRKESRGAHFRSDFPEHNDDLRKILTAQVAGGSMNMDFRDLPERSDGR